MPTTIQEQCLAALFVQLQTVAALVPGLTVLRNPDLPEDAEYPYPALVQLDADNRDTLSNRLTGTEERRVTFAIEGYVKAATSTLARAAAEQLRGHAIRAIQADVSLGGLAIDCATDDDDAARDTELPRSPAADFALEVHITYWVSDTDPFSLG